MVFATDSFLGQSELIGNKQKSEPHNGITRKLSTLNFPKKRTFLTPDTHSYVYVSGGKKCSFFRKICFLATSVLRFVFLPYCRRI